MYAKGMSTSDIEEHIRDIYGLEISAPSVISQTRYSLLQRNGSRDRLKASMQSYFSMLSTTMYAVKDRSSRRLYT